MTSDSICLESSNVILPIKPKNNPSNILGQTYLSLQLPIPVMANASVMPSATLAGKVMLSTAQRKTEFCRIWTTVPLMAITDRPIH